MALRPSIGILVVLSLLWFSVSAQPYQILADKDFPKDCSALIGSYSDSLEWQKAIESTSACLRFLGYLQFESTYVRDSTGLSVTYSPGAEWDVRYTNGEEQALVRRIEDRPELLQRWANAGYPFARLETDSLRFSGKEIVVHEQLIPGPEVRIDSLPPSPGLRIPEGYLHHHFGLKEKRLFRQKTIDDLEKRANQLEFLSFARAPQLLFTEDGAWVYLYPQKRRANRFDLLVGFNNSPDQATRFSGQADIRLVNAFKSGEWIDIRWQAPPDGAQQLDLELGLPYIFKSRFWLEGALEIYRRDSSFLNLDLMAKLRYAHSANAGVGVVYRGQRSRAGSGGEDLGLSDVRKDLFGLELRIDDRNDLFSPDRGGLYVLEGTAGRRTNLDQSGTQYRLQGEADVFLHLWGRHILRTRAQGAALIGDDLVENELFRIGGRNDLRGFPEQSLFSSHFAIGTLEYRYRLESSTYLQLFGDGAWRQAITGDGNAFYGVGGGISLLLQRAFIQIDIAVPNSGQGFDFRSAVLHLGYAGRF